MANRATEAEVKEIIDTALTAEQVAPFLATANVLVTSVLSDEGYDGSLMKEIERWLAAHFVAIRDPRIAKEKVDDADATYQGKFGENLRHTSYGQQVLVLDFHGRLAEIASSKGSIEVRTIT